LTSSRQTPAGARLPEIDALKGLAILSVLAIHAALFVGTPVYTLLINRAVPVFLVLFGYTSSLWWTARAGAPVTGVYSEWIRSRAARLMIPVWAVVLTWWAMHFLLLPPFELPSFRQLIASLLGYLPWLHTGWFVTLILELVVLFPLLFWSVRRLGMIPALAVAAGATALSHYFMFDVIRISQIVFLDRSPEAGPKAFFYFWIFSPQYFWLIVSGVVLAETQAAQKTNWILAATVTWVALVACARQTVEPSRLYNALYAFADVPLTVILLSATRAGIEAWPAYGRVMARLGVYSWGLYLGQLLVHHIVRLESVSRSWRPENERLLSSVRFVVLLAGAVALVYVGNRLRERPALARLESRLAGR
jgi:peptidoglycan/LPS O-acetylase OafA/YrhL